MYYTRKTGVTYATADFVKKVFRVSAGPGDAYEKSEIPNTDGRCMEMKLRNVDVTVIGYFYEKVIKMACADYTG